MKTVNKQQLVILMLLVIPATMMTVTIMTTQMAKAEIQDGGVLGGLRDGQAQAENDERAGVDNNNCDPAHSNLYCDGYIGGYTGEHAHFNLLHPPKDR